MCSNNLPIQLHDIVNNLIEGNCASTLIRQWKTFYHHLETPSPNFQQWERSYNNTGIEVYELFHNILQHWVSEKQTEATTTELERILQKGQFIYSAERISKLGDKQIKSNVISKPKATQFLLEPGKWKTFYTTNKEKASEVDETRDITVDHWVVSLARNPDNDKNDQHTFLILEAIIDGECKTIFMDFITNHRSIADNLGRKRGQIRKFEHFGLYGLVKSMLEVRPGQKLSAMSFDISPELGLKLIKNVDIDMKDLQPFFNFLGPESVLAASSATSCSNDIGYNCYGWASDQLRRLDKNKFRKLKPDFKQYIVTYPARYLPSKKTSTWDSKSVWYLVTLAVCLSSVFSIAVYRYFSFEQL